MLQLAQLRVLAFYIAKLKENSLINTFFRFYYRLARCSTLKYLQRQSSFKRKVETKVRKLIKKQLGLSFS